MGKLKFKVGDKVKYIGLSDYEFKPEDPDTVGIVQRLDGLSGQCYVVRWRIDQEWYYYSEQLRLVKEKPTTLISESLYK